MSGRVGGDGFLWRMGEDMSRDGSKGDSSSCLAADVGSGVAVVGGALLIILGLWVSASSGSTKGGKSVSLTGGAGAEGVALRVMRGGRAEVVRVGAVEPESRPEPVGDVP